ncbi:MAG TPA: FHA domain-containing protein [Anaerolineae bacterium]|nr:FHA domain-containing protein [Anaerolineae bacterium]
MANDSYQLVVRNAPQSGLTPGQTIALEDNVLMMGRDPLSDIILDDPEVSRHHAKLMLQAEGYELQDLGSTNGTFVDGQRLGGEPQALGPGQVIMLGSNVTLVYQATAAVDPLATMVAPVAAIEEEPAAAEVSVEPAQDEIATPVPVTAPADEEPDIVEELDAFAAEVMDDADDAEMATMMDESPFVAPIAELPAEPEPLPELPIEFEPVAEEPVFEPPPAPEPPAAAFEEPDKRNYVDSAAPVTDYADQPPTPPPPDYGEPVKEGGSNRNKIIIAVVAVLLICCCLTIVAGILFANYLGTL